MQIDGESVLNVLCFIPLSQTFSPLSSFNTRLNGLLVRSVCIVPPPSFPAYLSSNLKKKMYFFSNVIKQLCPAVLERVIAAALQ